MKPLSVFLILTTLAWPALAQSSSLTIEEQGARLGQAIAAAKICPGARQTAKAAGLAASLEQADRAIFDAASSRIQLAWEESVQCRDVDPAQYPREINSCRKMKILNCTATWNEIGPEGTALPGLLDFAPSE